MKVKKERHRTAHLGDWPGDNMTWRGMYVASARALVFREVGNPSREFSINVAELLAEKVGYAGATVDAFKEGARR